MMLDFLFRRRSTDIEVAAAAAIGREAALAMSIDRSLADRRAHRAVRKEAALRREADKRHAQFLNDPLIQSRSART